MITAKLNRLVAAYRQARRMVGEANQGKAILGTAFRFCRRLREAVWEEIERINALLGRKKQPSSNPTNPARS